MLEHGMVDVVVHRKDLRGTLGRILDLLGRRVPSATIVPLDTKSENVVAIQESQTDKATADRHAGPTQIGLDLAADD
jgi:acetyl-CoA carboxylase carboxyl transferase subunit beta